MANSRTLRLEGEFQRALSEILFKEFKDPRLSKMIGITRVEITPDLKYAKVYVSIYDREPKVKSTMIALANGAGFLRAKLNDKIKVRRIPELLFLQDDSIAYSIRMAKLIDDVTKEDDRKREKSQNHETTDSSH